MPVVLYTNGELLCRQQPGQALDDPGQLIETYFAQHPEAEELVITNLSSACFSLKDTVLELQQPIT